MSWKENFKEGKELILATCSKSRNPNANIVISLGFIDNRLLIADCQMRTTIENLKENKKIVVIGGYYRIIGSVEIFASGKYFNICAEKNKGYKVKNAILVDIEKVFDLNKQKILFDKTPSSKLRH
jgi:hypothetical protein